MACPEDLGTMQDCLQELTWALRSNEDQKLVEEWMLQEITKTLHSIKNSKTPGADGLPKEFYITFCDPVGLDWLEAYRERLQKGHLRARMDQGLITLFARRGQGRS